MYLKINYPLIVSMQRYYILVISLIISLNISAQLSVRNNAYVYANDIVVFVNDDVNLEESTAHFYLRNGAQLMQGNGTTGNSGIGKLSVYQNGNAGAAAYNYWCSPVGNTLANDNSNRPFRANNNIYDVTAAPITSSLATYTSGYNGSSNPLVIANYWFFTYDPGVDYSEWDQVFETGDVTPGYGFTMKGTSGSGNNQLYDFRGKPNNRTMFTAIRTGEETLIGNPYPSALDSRDFIHDAINSSLLDSGTLYFWEQDLTVTSHVIANYRGGYATYTINAAGTVETFIPATFDSYDLEGNLNNLGSTSSSGKQVHRYLPIGQGFMVSGSANGNLRVNNTMRDYVKEAASVSEFFRTTTYASRPNDDGSPEQVLSYNDNGLQIIPNDYKRFRLNIDFDDTYTRQLVQTFHHTASPDKDYGLESKSSELIESDAYWLQDGEPYAAQAFYFSEDLTIPLIINIDNQQLIRVRIFDVQHFDSSQPIYLHDIDTGTYTNLRLQNFEASLEPGSYSERFEITFTSEALSTNDILSNDTFTVFQNNQLAQLTIKNPNVLNVKQINFYDIQGKQLFNKLDLAISDEYTFSTKGLSDGTYIVNIALDSGESVSKKVIVFNR